MWNSFFFRASCGIKWESSPGCHLLLWACVLQRSSPRTKSHFTELHWHKQSRSRSLVPGQAGLFGLPLWRTVLWLLCLWPSNAIRVPVGGTFMVPLLWHEAPLFSTLRTFISMRLVQIVLKILWKFLGKTFFIIGRISDEQLWRMSYWCDISETRSDIRLTAEWTDLTFSISLNISYLWEMQKSEIWSQVVW